MAEVTENFRETIQKAGLPQEQVDAWIISTAQRTKNTQEQVAQTFLKCLNTIEQGNLSKETYLERLFSRTIGEIASGLSLKVTKIGFFPGATRKDGTVSGEMLGLAKIGDRYEHALIIGRGGKGVQKLADPETFRTYSTKINLSKVNEGLYKGWLDEGTMFTEVDSDLTEEQILQVYQPVPLSDAGEHLAGFESADNAFVDKSHVRRVKDALIYEVNLQEKWALLGLTDSDFIPSHERPLFPAWVDPSVLKRAGTGEGSFVDMLGVFELDNKGRPCLQVCSIQPLLKRPLRETPQGANSGENIRVLNISI